MRKSNITHLSIINTKNIPELRYTYKIYTEYMSRGKKEPNIDRDFYSLVGFLRKPVSDAYQI